MVQIYRYPDNWHLWGHCLVTGDPAACAGAGHVAYFIGDLIALDSDGQGRIALPGDVPIAIAMPFGMIPLACAEFAEVGPPVGDDAAGQELVDRARANDEAGFRELAGCVMPSSEIDECWTGVRLRLGLPPW